MKPPVLSVGLQVKDKWRQQDDGNPVFAEESWILQRRLRVSSAETWHQLWQYARLLRHNLRTLLSTDQHEDQIRRHSTVNNTQQNGNRIATTKLSNDYIFDCLCVLQYNGTYMYMLRLSRKPTGNRRLVANFPRETGILETTDGKLRYPVNVLVQPQLTLLNYICNRSQCTVGLQSHGFWRRDLRDRRQNSDVPIRHSAHKFPLAPRWEKLPISYIYGVLELF